MDSTIKIKYFIHYSLDNHKEIYLKHYELALKSC